jgi:ABC-type uncharacterized transport system substrate-binding protein
VKLFWENKCIGRCSIFLLLLAYLVGCSTLGDNSVKVSKNQYASEEKTTDTKENDKKSVTKPDFKVETKKVYYIQQDKTELNEGVLANFKSVLKANGYSGEALNLKVNCINSEPLSKKEIEDRVFLEIQAFAPDVVILDFGVINFTCGLKKRILCMDIPVFTLLVTNDVEKEFNFLKPNQKARLTGVDSSLDKLEVKSLELLKRISNPEGKKVAFIHDGDFIKIKDIERVVNKCGMDMKLFEAKYLEGWLEAVERINADPEVAYMVTDAFPTSKRDGSLINGSDAAVVIMKRAKKPGASIYEFSVQIGYLIAVAFDTNDFGNQIGKMVVRYLNGESIENIRPEEAKSTRIILNMKVADDMGLKIPPDIFQGAWKIYTGYGIENNKYYQPN